MSNQIDVNQLSNALQQKIDLPSGKSQADIDYVVEWQAPTAENNYTWYRLYKSGWIEQGGISEAIPGPGSIHVALPKQMLDTNYIVLMTNTDYNITDAPGLSAKSTQSFNADYNSSSFSGTVSWKVEGMVAQS